MTVIRKRVTASADPHREVIDLNLRETVSLIGITAEIVTAAGSSPLFSFRLTDATRDNSSSYDGELLTDEAPSSNAAGKRVAWQPSVPTKLRPNEYNVALYVRDFNGGVVDIVINLGAV